MMKRKHEDANKADLEERPISTFLSLPPDILSIILNNGLRFPAFRLLSKRARSLMKIIPVKWALKKWPTPADMKKLSTMFCIRHLEVPNPKNPEIASVSIDLFEPLAESLRELILDGPISYAAFTTIIPLTRLEEIELLNGVTDHPDAAVHLLYRLKFLRTLSIINHCEVIKVELSKLADTITTVSLSDFVRLQLCDESTIFRNLVSLHFNYEPHSEVLERLVTVAPFLRHLHMLVDDIDDEPQSIDEAFSSLTRLHHLEKLNLSSPPCHLPTEVSRLTRLRTLALDPPCDDCSRLSLITSLENVCLEAPTDYGLYEALARVTQLKRVVVALEVATGHSLSALSALQRLHTLYLTMSTVNTIPEGLSHLTQLQELSLYAPRAQLPPFFAKLTSLTRLYLRLSPLNTQSVRYLADLPKLQMLLIERAEALVDTSIRNTWKRIPDCVIIHTVYNSEHTQEFRRGPRFGRGPYIKPFSSDFFDL